MKKIIYSVLIATAILFVVVGYKIISTLPVGGGAGQTATSCTTSTVTAATVGTTSSTVLAAHSNRAWARIQAPNSATSTIFLAFNAGTAATVNNGLALNESITNGASSTPHIDFGRNTDFPYTGIVTGIVRSNEANNASTTVLVTECRY